MPLESREYQNFIIQEIAKKIELNQSVILELDCGMGKRVLVYRLLVEIFKEQKVVVFLQTHSSLEETSSYLEKEYGGIEGLATIKSGSNSKYRKYIIENNRVILTLPIVFSNTLKKFPQLAREFNIVIINEVDQIIKRISQHRVLCVPWNTLIQQMSETHFIGMSGTLRDEHIILDENQLHLRNELKTLIEFIPNSSVISIEDFLDTDLENYIKNTEVHIHPIIDDKTAEIIQMLTTRIEEVKEEIIQEVSETSPKDLYQLKKNFFNILPMLSIDTELIEKLNRLLLLRKYVYSMPASTYYNYLIRYGFSRDDLSNLPKNSGKELEALKIAKQHQKTTILCSFLSTVSSLSELIEKEGFAIFQVTGRTKNKNEIIQNFKDFDDRAALILSPIGERDLDIPQTDMIIVFDLVNSPKTVYQKFKRSRGGKVVLLFYDDTPERQKVKRVVSEIAIRYPWSTIFYSDK
ncbi:MAG: DEAD/DEAH box helicase family protein [Asgard group archaeon]|nr:DEAD/DEAH box helicase family protein [Asgard group archaeon]